MKKILTSKLREALFAILPITIIVFLLHLTIVPMSKYQLALFFIGSFMLLCGMGFFTLGADISMMQIGELVGSYITKTKKLPLIVFVTFIIGFIITIAEPDLKILATQTPNIPTNVLIVAVAIGVGIFLVIAFLRVFLQLQLSYLLIILYTIVFLIASFTDKDFLAVAFDSGGVTTGPITVPFILALGIGLASVRGDKTTDEDSFGLVALCSVGPILTVLLLGIFFQSKDATYTPITLESYSSLWNVAETFIQAIPVYCREVAAALSPIIIFFLIFQAIALRLEIKSIIKILVGLLYTYIGLVLFLTGVNIGFMPIGYFLGKTIIENSSPIILILLGMIIGYFIVSAEPAVHVLKQQVQDLTDGVISGRAMGLSLSIGVAVSVGLAMLRVVNGISIWYLIIPGYAFALIMTFFVSPLFTSIAFDSGGVASGPMTATFLLPFAIGACEAVGGNIVTDGFGIVTMVAMTPLITIQALGLIYKIKSRKSETNLSLSFLDDSIIDYNLDEFLSDTEGGKKDYEN